MSTLSAVGELIKQGVHVAVQSKPVKAVADIKQVQAVNRHIPWSKLPTCVKGYLHTLAGTQSQQLSVETTVHVGIQTFKLTGDHLQDDKAELEKDPPTSMNIDERSYFGSFLGDIFDPSEAPSQQSDDKHKSSPSSSYKASVAPAITARRDYIKTQKVNSPAQNEYDNPVVKPPKRHDDSYQAQNENELLAETSSPHEYNCPTQSQKETSVVEIPKGQEDSYRVQDENEKPVAEESIRQEDHPDQKNNQQSPTETPRFQDDHLQPATTTGPKEAEHPASNTGAATTDSLSSATQANVDSSANQDSGNDVKTGAAQIPKNNDEPVGEGVAKQSEPEPTEVCSSAEAPAQDSKAATASVIEIPREEYQALKQDVESLKNQVKRLEERPPIAQASGGAEGMGPEGSNHLGLVWIVPEIIHKDDRLSRPLHQLAQRVHEQMEIRSLPSSSITFSYTGNVILPVIATSRVGSDIQAAMQKAKLKVPCVVLIFNHLAPHNSRIRTPTKDRLSDRQLVESCQDMLDLVFWNGSMYDCEANTRAVHTLRGIWKIRNDN